MLFAGLAVLGVALLALGLYLPRTGKDVIAGLKANIVKGKDGASWQPESLH